MYIIITHQIIIYVLQNKVYNRFEVCEKIILIHFFISSYLLLILTRE